MNQKKTVILGIGFLSLAIFMIIVIAMISIKKSDAAAVAEKNIEAFVASRNIPVGQKITLDDIEKRSLPKEYVGEQPLAIGDIVEHYASVDIMKSDLIRSEKMGLVALPEPMRSADENASFEEKVADKVMVHDMISLPLNVFKNPDTTLHVGERIDILGISEYGEVKPQFATRYIALSVKVGGFMKDGQAVDKIASVTVDEKTQAATKVMADEILLDMAPPEIGRFLSLYYRSQVLNNDHAHNANNLFQGHIWMVKCNPGISVREESQKQRMMNPVAVARPKVKRPPLPSMASLPPLTLARPKGIVSYEQ